MHYSFQSIYNASFVFLAYLINRSHVKIQYYPNTADSSQLKKIRNQDIFLLNIKIRKKLQYKLLGYTGAYHKIQQNANVITFINNHNILLLT